jgi:Ca-activated chloride channel family protein
MNWGSPAWLDLLWAVPVIGVLLVLALRRRAFLLGKLGALASERVSRRASTIHRLRAVFWLAGMVMGLVALAQPRWGFRWQELKREGLDIVVALDVSSSMDAEDVSPSRMERARREVLDLTELVAGDRVGLVVFAGGSYPRMPLTLDYGVLRHQVKDSDSGTLVAQGSDIGAAIDMAAKLLGPRGAADQVILLISDGEDHAGEAMAAAEAAAEAGIHIYTMGVGTQEGAPVPLKAGGFKKSGSGEVIISRLDAPLLESIARVGRGAFVQSGASNRDISAIYVEEIRGQLQGAEQGVRRERIWDERYAWPLSAAIVCLMLGVVIRPGPLRLPGAALALVFVALGTRPVMAQDAEQDAPSMAEQLASEQAAKPDDLGLAEALGMALLEDGRADEAHDVLSMVAERSLDPAQRKRARYNAGHAAHRSGHLTRAVEDWRRVLQDSPDDTAAQTNVQVLEQEIARRLQEQPPPEEDTDGQDGDGEEQEGQEQEGEEQEGQEQEGQEGQEQDGQSQDSPSDPGENGTPEDAPPESTDGTRPEAAEAGDTGLGGNMDELQADGTESTDPDTPPSGQSSGAVEGEMSAEEAARTVDSVEEGRPQVVARPGAAGDKDW